MFLIETGYLIYSDTLFSGFDTDAIFCGKFGVTGSG